MPHQTALIATIAAAFGVAFVLGLLAARLRLPPLVGYLVAGIVVGPFSPGYVADAGLASQLAELGVILLMFGVGMHFSLRDLAAARRVVVPGAILQTAITAAVGGALAWFWGWGAGGAAVVGLSLGVASTVVMLKGLEGRDRLDSPDGRLAVGWLVVEDVLMVFALVLLPALAPVLRGGVSGDAGAMAAAIGLAVVKVLGFVALMFFVGRRFVPWLLEHVAHVGSRELFTLAVLAIALGIGFLASSFFGVSFALGAFFAGAVIAESELSHRAAADALPMQDAFAVLFFVSVGMLFDPATLVQRPFEIATLVAVVVLWKPILTYALVRLLGQSERTATLLGGSLGQIGEFSFIVAGLGVGLGIVRPEVQAVVVAAALIAITLNGPLLAAAVAVTERRAAHAAADAMPPSARMTREMRIRDFRMTREASAGATDADARHSDATVPPDDVDGWDATTSDPYDFSELTDHVVLVGYGRVGSTVADALARADATHVVIEELDRVVVGLRQRSERAVHGDATRRGVLERAGIVGAQLLVVTAPEPIRARRIIALAREVNPALNVAVRTHSAAEQAYFEQTLEASGAGGRAVYAEREAALSLAHYALMQFGRSDDEADVVVGGLRDEPTRPTEMFRALATQEFRTMTRSPKPQA